MFPKPISLHNLIKILTNVLNIEIYKPINGINVLIKFILTRPALADFKQVQVVHF
jgi:hypothetical protein